MRTLAIAVLAMMSGLAFAGELEERDLLERTFSLAGVAQPLVTIDNINGSIDIEGYAGDEVRLRVEKTIFAKDEQKLAAAKRDVSLEIEQGETGLALWVKTPYRPALGEWRDGGDSGYRVQYRFVAQIPQRSRLNLKTVNHGDVAATDVHGNFEVRNVNGEITLAGLRGSGDATTVNGAVRALFDAYPESGCAFKTVNGDLEVRFPRNLAADIRCKTFNGEVFSDFEATLLPAAPPKKVKKGRGARYETDPFTSYRIGGGGALLSFDTLNGDILIRSD